MRRPAPQPGRFVARRNRFVVQAALADGTEALAHLANTARLGDLLTPGARLLLEPAQDPARRTRWSVTRVWDGTWVALKAADAADLVADHLAGGAALPGWPATVEVHREVTLGHHRLDLKLRLSDDRGALVEVKSLSRVRDGVAGLSHTPSVRGVSQLQALTHLARTGTPAAVVFVVQRADARELDLTAPADTGWQDAVRTARRAGVHVTAYRCRVRPREVSLAEALPVRPPQPSTTGRELLFQVGSEVRT